MRRYDDPVEVRRGRVGQIEGPEQFLWHGKLWKVSAMLAHWVETGPWWRSSGVHAVLGEEVGSDTRTVDLLAEREVWRVEAAHGGSPVTGPVTGPAPGPGVFDLVLDWADGSWRLIRCVD